MLPGDDPNVVDIDALYRAVREGHCSLTDAAQRLGTTLDIVRHLLDAHPAPARQTQNSVVDKARNALPKELLTRLYVEQQLALEKVADHVGVSRRTVNHLCDEYGIARRGHGRPFKVVVSRDWFYEQYVNRQRTLPDLAQEIGMSPTNLTRWAKARNVPLRPHRGASHDDVRGTPVQAATAPPLLQPALTTPHAWERLHRFVAAAKYPTIRAAAGALGLHESVLVVQISQLEHALGGQLLTRALRTRPMRLTSLGQKVIAAVRKCWHEETPSN